MTELAGLDRVAVLALVWRDCWRKGICNEAEFDSYRYEFGFLPKAITEHFSKLDWFIVEAFVMSRDKTEALAALAREVNTLSKLRGEAMLHFWVHARRPQSAFSPLHSYSRTLRRRMPPVGDWRDPYLGVRWDGVEDLMFSLEQSGLYMMAEDVSAVADQAEVDHAHFRSDAFASDRGWDDLLRAAEATARPHVA